MGGAVEEALDLPAQSARQSVGPYVLAFFMIVNSAATAFMYFRILGLGAYSDPVVLAQVREYVWPDLLFTVTPQLAAAVGIVRRKSWGMLLGLMVCAIYLHSMGVLLAGAANGAPITAMFYVDFYFLGFAMITVGYLLKCRKQFT